MKKSIVMWSTDGHKINSFRHDSYLSLSEGRKEKEPTGGSQGRLLIGAALALAS